MEFQAQEILNLFLTLFSAGIVFVIKSFYFSIKELERKHIELVQKNHSFELHVTGEYVTRAELNRIMDGISRKLERIEQLISDKEDKHP